MPQALPLGRAPIISLVQRSVTGGERATIHTRVANQPPDGTGGPMVMGLPFHPVWPASPPPLVGRDRELAVLHGRLSAARNGRGSLVLIGGEAGIGKTALAEALCREATGAGVHVLTGNCYDRTETPPFGPWVQISRRVRAFPDSANIPPVPRLAGATSQSDVFAQTRDYLAALSADRPLVLVLEDLHWADSASLDLLRFIAHGIDDLPLLLVATYRGEDIDRWHPLAAIVPLLVREAPTERLGLRPLDTDAAQALVRARYDLAEQAAQRLAVYLIERTEGNALFMIELLRTLEENRLLDHFDQPAYAEIIAQTPVPALLTQIIDDRLSRLGDETAALLAIAAVVGQEVPLAVWEAVAPADEEALLTVAERAEAAHLVSTSTRSDSIRFTHALIRDVLVEHVPALRRRRIHRQVAEALIALPTPDPDAVAYHFQQAGDDRAAAWLTRSGERAEDAYALVTAAERYESAFTLLDAQDGEPTERGWLRLVAAALRRHDDRDRAIAWVDEAARLGAMAGDASLGARAQALSGLIAGLRGDYRGAMANMTAAADSIDHLSPGSGSARRREQLIDKVVNRGTLTTYLAYGGRFTEAREQGEAYLARLPDIPTVTWEFGAIADVQMGLAQAYTFQGEPALARRAYAATVSAFQASDNHVMALGILREELVLSVLPYHADDLAERERAAAAAERMAVWVVERGGHVNPSLPQYARIPLLVLEGKWREARTILEPASFTDFMLTGRVRPLYLGTIARAQGDLETAWQCVHAPALAKPDDEPGERMGTLLVRFQLLAAGLALDAGDLGVARGWLDRHRRWMEFMDATLGRSEEAALEAAWCRAAGDLVRASDYAEQALAHATTPRQPLALIAAHRMLGILDTDAGRGPEAEGHFAEALALAGACRAPYERALTLLELAELAATQGDRATATAVLAEVRAICDPLDARPALAQADRIAARLSRDAESATERAALPAGLTVREVEVLRLVATGLSNAEIADKLFLSPNTVKVHVARILAKIEVNNRAGATEFALRHGIA